MHISKDAYLSHYGTPRESGRYPWGSSGWGETKDTNMRNKSFLDYVRELKRQGIKETDIADGLGIKTPQLRARITQANAQQKQAEILMAQRLKDKGYSVAAIARRMNMPEPTVRDRLKPGAKDKADILMTTSNMLRSQVDEKKYIDIGTGTEAHIGVSREKLNAAVHILKEDGYKVHYIKEPQLGTDHETTIPVLTKDDVPYSEVSQNRDKIQLVSNYSKDTGRTFYGIKDPMSIDSKRVKVLYGDEGGEKADGVMFIRPGVKDLSIGDARYAQVRVLVDNTHYLKGMAIPKDDLPDGVDILFNTNKKNTGNKLDALKQISDDKDNPFGASLSRQIIERDEDGTERLTSAMNIVNEEGTWSGWSKNLSTQMLSKQSPKLARDQLAEAYSQKEKEFKEIDALTNPTIRKKLLEKFGDEASSSAVHMEAAALPRQAYHVILPVDSIPPTKIYAPNYQNGERVVLIRYPHGGVFEIPELTVDNSNPEAKKLLGSARDAVGIHHSVAERLSGADFDGDSVVVIPNNSGKVKTAPAIESLMKFDNKASYPYYEGMKVMTPRQTQNEMGKISNLITDMTIKEASTSEIVRAVKHSMVVIDAEKHKLNWKQSALDHNIKQLKEKYQSHDDGSGSGGASTLISKATSDLRVPARKPRRAADGGPIDKETGERMYESNDRTTRKTRTTRLAEERDAHNLSSGTPIERVYADHANRLKELGNRARKASVLTERAKYSKSARKVYEKEVASLNAKYSEAIRNRPRERQAQLLGNAIVRMKRDANPNMDRETLKKIKFQALNEARSRTGAEKKVIDITDNEWEAIQSGALSDDRVSKILDDADLERVKELATPRFKPLMTSAKTQRAQSMLSSGATRAEVARALGVSLSTLDRATVGGE